MRRYVATVVATALVLLGVLYGPSLVQDLRFLHRARLVFEAQQRARIQKPVVGETKPMSDPR